MTVLPNGPTLSPDLAECVNVVRKFNRFYTRKIGVLREGLLQSPFSLTEVRVLYEIAHQQKPTAAALCRELGTDPGYLSRMLRDFEKRGLVEKTMSADDGRQNLLALTASGQEMFSSLDERSSKDVAAMLGPLSPSQQIQLFGAMRTIERLLGRPSDNAAQTPFLLRAHQPGDMGWVVQRHGILYARDYGYDERFEALVAEIVAEFVEHYDSKRERCWIAEKDGENVGSVFLVKKSRTVAKLRLLLVEPSARGLGIGKRLVTECLRFARQAQYKTVRLWTQSELHAARRIYAAAGFRLVDEKPHKSWGRDNLVAETWEITL